MLLHILNISNFLNLNAIKHLTYFMSSDTWKLLYNFYYSLEEENNTFIDFGLVFKVFYLIKSQEVLPSRNLMLDKKLAESPH